MNKTMLNYLSIISFIVPAVSMLYALPGFSAERDYVVPMIDSKWIMNGKKNYECILSQTIPFYGEGKFIHRSGNGIIFNLISDKLMVSDVRVVLQSEPPAWRHEEVFEIGEFIFEQGTEPLVIQPPYASRIFQEVENGMSPLVIYRDLADGRDLISVLLSPINFRSALEEYLECEKTLLDFDLDEIKNIKLYFSTNKSTLSERSKRDLKNILRYLKIDSTILQIKVDAHADARGRRRFNDKLSETRSAAVVKYLLSVGAKQEMIYAVSHGERAPTFNNKTSAGRAQNRRADIQLLTTAPPTPEEQEALEKARKAERRQKLLAKSIFNGVPKKPLSKKTSNTDDIPDTASNEEAGIEPVDDEPPAPNFINMDHLVDKNNNPL
ncbi:MAG: OmpA family protein [gamma proteobacterium symbiont of Taylorina sp.]|nr:OmpA family protein [gamma proteobacterium symbiont of Taylorina sp.]